MGDNRFSSGEGDFYTYTACTVSHVTKRVRVEGVTTKLLQTNNVRRHHLDCQYTPCLLTDEKRFTRHTTDKFPGDHLNCQYTSLVLCVAKLMKRVPPEGDRPLRMNWLTTGRMNACIVYFPSPHETLEPSVFRDGRMDAY